MGSSKPKECVSVCSWDASPLPGVNGTVIFWPAFFAAFSIPTQPPKTIKSANETNLLLVLKPFCIFSKDLSTLDNSDGLLTSQSFWGASLILAPLAPPLLSEPLKVDADAQAVDTSWDIESPDFEIFALRTLISLFLSLYLTFGIGSCQINYSFGTSGPK